MPCSGAGKTFTLRELLFFLTLADDWAPGNGSYTKQDAPDKAVPLHARIQDLLELGEGMMSCATTENRSSTRSTTIVEVSLPSGSFPPHPSSSQVPAYLEPD